MDLEDLETQYWVDVSPEDFEYGRTYRLFSYEKEGGTPVMEIPNTGSGSLQESYQGRANFLTIERDRSLQDKIAYGSMGSYQSVIIPADRAPARAVAEIFGALSDYPVLDDLALSNVEEAAAEEAWDNFGRREFVRSVLVPSVDMYLTKQGVDTDDLDIEDVIDNLDYPVIDSVWKRLARNHELVIFESDGPYFHFGAAQRLLATGFSDEELGDWLAPVLTPFMYLIGPSPDSIL